VEVCTKNFFTPCLWLTSVAASAAAADVDDDGIAVDADRVRQVGFVCYGGHRLTTAASWRRIGSECEPLRQPTSQIRHNPSFCHFLH